MKLSNELLTIEDFKLLQQNKQPEARETIARKIGFHFDSTAKESVEYCIACEIAFYLQKDDEAPVRIALAKSVHKSDNAPTQLVLLLAMDDEDAVSLPILQYSPVLKTSDLMDVLPKIDKPSRLIAVAKREFLSVTVSSMLVERNIENVVASLLENNTAILGDEVVLQIAYKYSRSRPILNRMMKRMPLPTLAVNHMVKIQQSAEQQNSRPSEIQSFSSLQKEDLKNDLLTLMFLGRKPSAETCDQMIMQIEKQGKASATFMLLALCLGQEQFFMHYMAYNTKLPVERVAELCNVGEQEFAMLMNKSGISPSLYPLIFHTFNGMERAIENKLEGGTVEFGIAMIECLMESEAKNINFATTIGKPLSKALKETFG